LFVDSSIVFEICKARESARERERERERRMYNGTEDKEKRASFNELPLLNGFHALLRFPVLFLPAKAIIERPEAAG